MTSTIESNIETPDGASIYAEKHPAQSPTADPTPIIYFHSFLNGCRSLDPILPSLTNRTIIAFDVEGHGTTAKPLTPPTLDTLVAYIPLILTHFGYNPTHPVDGIAYSIGTCIALHLAVQTPPLLPRFRTLVVLAPPNLSEPKELWEATAQQVRTQRTEDYLLFCLSLLGSKARTDAVRRDAIQKRMQRDLSRDRGFMSEMWRACAVVPEYWAKRGYREKRVADERYVFWGREDGHSDRNACEVTARIIGAKIVPVDTGSFMTLENPQAVGDELKKIFNS